LFLLYQQDLLDLSAVAPLERAEQAGAVIDPYTRRLVCGVAERQAEIDGLVGAHLRGWTLDRLGTLERSLLRIAVFEILSVEDVPAAVAIDEAVELAKRYASDEGAGLLNGVLGALADGR